MAFEKNYESPEELGLLPACVHLRSKGMLVRGSREDEGSIHDAGNANCWCNHTQHVIGPDDQVVERHTCVEGRKCYKEVL